MTELLRKLLETNVNQPLTLGRIATTLTVTLVMGLLILAVYRTTYRGVLENRTFGTALLMVSLVTSLVIMPISSNLVLSLGMVGALSIVRFRTALKDPLDIVFMFWAIALGLTAGAGFLELAVVGCLALAVIMVLATLVQRMGRIRRPFLLVLRTTDAFQGDLARLVPPFRIKSKTVTPQSVELVVEIRVDPADTSFLERLQKVPGVLSASLVRYSGDF